MNVMEINCICLVVLRARKHWKSVAFQSLSWKQNQFVGRCLKGSRKHNNDFTSGENCKLPSTCQPHSSKLLEHTLYIKMCAATVTLSLRINFNLPVFQNQTWQQMDLTVRPRMQEAHWLILLPDCNNYQSVIKCTPCWFFYILKVAIERIKSSAKCLLRSKSQWAEGCSLSILLEAFFSQGGIYEKECRRFSFKTYVL